MQFRISPKFSRLLSPLFFVVAFVVSAAILFEAIQFVQVTLREALQTSVEEEARESFPTFNEAGFERLRPKLIETSNQ